MLMRGLSGQQAKEEANRPAALSRQSMRAFMAALDQAGKLATIGQPVSPEYEIAACLAEADSGPALRFERVTGYEMPVVGNLINSLPRIGMGLGTTPEAMQSAIIAAIEAPLAHRAAASAPCREKIVVDPVLTDELP